MDSANSSGAIPRSILFNKLSILKPIAVVAESTISRHLKNIFDDGEVDEDSVVGKFATAASDGENYNAQVYTLTPLSL